MNFITGNKRISWPLVVGISVAIQVVGIGLFYSVEGLRINV